MITPKSDFDWYAIAGGIRGPDFHIWSSPLLSGNPGIGERLKYIFTARIRHLCGIRASIMCSVRGPLSDMDYDIKSVMNFLSDYKEYAFDTKSASHYMAHVASALRAINRVKDLDIMDKKLLNASWWLFEFFDTPTSAASDRAHAALADML